MAETRRREFLKGISGGALGAAAATDATAASAAPARPNVLVIMSDQQRAGLTRRSGYPLDTMPALDRLAERGVRFEHAYCTAPLCVPSRVSLLTGRWPHAHRVRENSAAQDAFFEKDLFDLARSLGYKTGLSGKNHSHLTPQKTDFWRPYMHLGGWKPDPAPKEMVAYEEWLQHLNYGTPDAPTPFPVEVQLPYRIVSGAMEFMQSVGGSPFLLWVSFPEPHNPYQVPKPYFDMFPPGAVPGRVAGPEVLKSKGFKWEWLARLQNATYPGYDSQWRRVKSNYLGMLRLIDDQVARLFQFMEVRGILQNTIVVYVSDHGDYLTDYGLLRKGVDLPEALVRIPMVWAGPGIQGHRNPPEFVSMADILPSIAEALGQPVPRGTQGRSLWPMLQGKEYPKEEFRSIYSEVGFGGLYYDSSDELDFRKAQIPGAPGAVLSFDELNSYTQSGYMKMVRMGDWKLTFDMLGRGQLYNLAEDPGELSNRYGDPAVARDQMRMFEELLTWNIRTQDNLPTARYEAKWPRHNWYWPYRAGS